MLAAGVAAAGLAYGMQTGDLGGQVPRLLGSALVHLPAVLVVTAITVVAFGVIPRLIALGWAALVAVLLLGEIGPLFGLDQQVLDLSPLTHTPKLPGGEFSATPLVWLSIVGLALLVAGFSTFRRQDN